MYFVMIDLPRLAARLVRSIAFGPAEPQAWLRAHGFTPTDGGWLASAEGMNRLHCTEILFSERRLFDLPRPQHGLRIAS